MTTIADLINVLERWAPKTLQETYDNSGLQIGNPLAVVKTILFSLDITPEVIEEARENQCNLIVAHHPLIFKPLKTITGQNMVEECVALAIRYDIAIYAIHTNLDNIHEGVNKKIANVLGIESPQILQPGKSRLHKIAVHVPNDFVDVVAEAMFDAGGGHIGNYSECSFRFPGQGTFKPTDQAKPFIGQMDKRHTESEHKIEIVAPDHNVQTILKAMKTAHPYEEVAYDVIPLQNPNPEVGSGMIGELGSSMDQREFLDHVKSIFRCNALRFTRNGPSKIKRVAFCGGSGSFLIERAKRANADAFITGDITYHSFFESTQSFMIVDVGHFESEQFTPEHLMQFVNKKMPTFATLLSKVHTNPVNIH
jgi:dinuclear metal center YbgI/SA1388 family protein